MKSKLPLFFLILLAAGCGRPTQLDRKAALLKPGMTKEELKSVFNGFRLQLETNEFTVVSGETKLYGSNRVSSSVIMFGPKPDMLMD
jgi:hypothetical protein